MLFLGFNLAYLVFLGGKGGESCLVLGGDYCFFGGERSESDPQK